MRDVPGTVRIAVGVLAERSPAATPWADWSWRVVGVTPPGPPIPDFTELRRDGARILFFAGTAEVALHPTDTANYRDNLVAPAPLVWVVLRAATVPHGLRLLLATVDGGEAEAFSDSGTDLLESLPLPEFLRAITAEFVATHHVERVFHKRRRNRVDTDGMLPAERRPGDDA